MCRDIGQIRAPQIIKIRDHYRREMSKHAAPTVHFINARGPTRSCAVKDQRIAAGYG